MILLATAKMGLGTFEAKFVPLSRVEQVTNIYILRKHKGPNISKVKYILLPKICNYKLLNIIIVPFLLAYYTKKINADLILSYHTIPHAFFAFIASKLTGKPYNISQTGLYIQKYSDNKIFSPFIKFIFKNANFINVPGQNSKKFWVNKGIRKEKIFTLHSTINTDIFKPNYNYKEYDFIFVGRLNYIKQIELLIYAFYRLQKEVPKINLSIVGIGPELISLEQLVNELYLQNKVTFEGFQKNTKEWLNKSKIFVMTSKSEGLPCALMEAMACELLVIAPDVGNVTDILIDNETGYLLNDTNEYTIYNKMKKTLLTYNNTEDIRKNARKKISEEHSFQSAIKQWESILEKF